jgi:ribosome-associated heat shock protein Hsp15
VDTVRIDKWLWAARFFKTRSLATDAVNGGRIHLNGSRVKPSRDVKPGDALAIQVGEQRFTVDVLVVSDKRGPAPAAATLYAETPESAAKRAVQAEQRRLSRPLGAELAGRPTKQDRRRLDALRKGQGQRGGAGR